MVECYLYEYAVLSVPSLSQDCITKIGHGFLSQAHVLYGTWNEPGILHALLQ